MSGYFTLMHSRSVVNYPCTCSIFHLFMFEYIECIYAIFWARALSLSLTHCACVCMLVLTTYVLSQRKELCKHRKKLEQRKKALQETVAHRKKFLSSLPSHLKSLKKASLPVQQQLGVLHMKKLKQQRLAELLPPPLYVIYSQLLTLKETFGENIDLELIGSLKDAQDIACQLANKSTGN